MTKFIRTNKGQYLNLDQFQEISIHFYRDSGLYHLVGFYKENSNSSRLEITGFKDQSEAQDWLDKVMEVNI